MTGDQSFSVLRENEWSEEQPKNSAWLRNQADNKLFAVPKFVPATTDEAAALSVDATDPLFRNVRGGRGPNMILEDVSGAQADRINASVSHLRTGEPLPDRLKVFDEACPYTLGAQSTPTGAQSRVWREGMSKFIESVTNPMNTVYFTGERVDPVFAMPNGRELHGIEAAYAGFAFITQNDGYSAKEFIRIPAAAAGDPAMRAWVVKALPHFRLSSPFIYDCMGMEYGSRIPKLLLGNNLEYYHQYEQHKDIYGSVKGENRIAVPRQYVNILGRITATDFKILYNRIPPQDGENQTILGCLSVKPSGKVFFTGPRDAGKSCIERMALAVFSDLLTYLGPYSEAETKQFMNRQGVRDRILQSLCMYSMITPIPVNSQLRILLKLGELHYTKMEALCAVPLMAINRGVRFVPQVDGTFLCSYVSVNKNPQDYVRGDILDQISASMVIDPVPNPDSLLMGRAAKTIFTLALAAPEYIRTQGDLPLLQKFPISDTIKSASIYKDNEDSGFPHCAIVSGHTGPRWLPMSRYNPPPPIIIKTQPVRSGVRKIT